MSHCAKNDNFGIPRKSSSFFSPDRKLSEKGFLYFKKTKLRETKPMPIFDGLGSHKRFSFFISAHSTGELALLGENYPVASLKFDGNSPIETKKDQEVDNHFTNQSTTDYTK